LKFSNRSTAPEQVDDDGNQSEHEKNVNEACGDVEGQESQQPQNEQNTRNAASIFPPEQNQEIRPSPKA
jgi:hypothetical protein